MTLLVPSKNVLLLNCYIFNIGDITIDTKIYYTRFFESYNFHLSYLLYSRDKLKVLKITNAYNTHAPNII